MQSNLVVVSKGSFGCIAIFVLFHVETLYNKLLQDMFNLRFTNHFLYFDLFYFVYIIEFALGF